MGGTAVICPMLSHQPLAISDERFEPVASPIEAGQQVAWLFADRGQGGPTDGPFRAHERMSRQAWTCSFIIAPSRDRAPSTRGAELVRRILLARQPADTPLCLYTLRDR